MAVEAKAWITGEYPDQEIHFELPSGPTGDIGPVGPVGPPVALEIGEVNVSASNLIEDERMAENILNGPLTQDAIKAQIPIEQIGATGPKGDPGGFVKGTSLTTSSDLNTLIADGIYRQAATFTPAASLNYPPGTTIGVLLVHTWIDGSVIQTYTHAALNDTSNYRTYTHKRTLFNGVWTKWTMDASVRVSNTAGKAIYMWDDSTNSEVLLTGDTGVRNVADALTAFGPGTCTLQRKGDSVFFTFILSSLTTPVDQVVYTFPDGFRPTNGGAFRHFFRDYQDRAWRILSYTLRQDTAVTDGSVWVSASFPTSDVWPTILPGTAA